MDTGYISKAQRKHWHEQGYLQLKQVLKRFSITAIVLIAFCAIALLPLMSVSNGDDVWQYVYYDYYFDANKKLVGHGKTVMGQLDDDLATDRAVITRFHKQCSDGTWEKITISGHYYEKNDDGEWIYWGGSWMTGQVIQEWFNQACN